MRSIYLFSRIYLLVVIISSFCSCQSGNNTPVTKNASFTDSVHDTIPAPIGFMNDFEDIFTADEEKYIDSLLAVFEKRTTIEIAVVTIDRTMSTAENLDDYTLQIGKSWGVGKEGVNNGLVIGISNSHKRMRIQNSSEIEKILSDIETKEIIDNNFIPAYREGKYFEGTVNGLLRLMSHLEKRSRRNPE